MASSAGKRTGGMKAGFLDSTNTKGKSAEPSLGDLLKMAESFKAELRSLAEEVTILKFQVAQRNPESEAASLHALEAKVARLDEAQQQLASRVEELGDMQDQQSKAALGCTVIVHAYPRQGGSVPTPDEIKADLMRPTNLPATEVLSCLPLRTAAADGGDEGVASAAVGASGEASGGAAASPGASPAPPPNPKPGCVSYKVVLASSEAAKLLMFTKRAHRQLGTGIVVRQALTASERALLQAFMPQYRLLRAAGEAVDFRRGRLHRRQYGKWVAVPLPASAQAP